MSNRNRNYGKSAWFKNLRIRVLERDNWECVLCGFQPPPFVWMDTVSERLEWLKQETADTGIGWLQLDHIQPYCQNGPTTYENLRVLCGPCNINKSIEENPTKPKYKLAVV